MASGDVFAVKLHMTYAGQQCRPGFYLIEGAGSGDSNPTRGLADFIVLNFSGGSIANFSEALTWEAVEVQDIQPATSRTWISQMDPATVGGVSDDNPPTPQDTMLIRWITALKGGKGLQARRGRTYVPGIYSTGQVSGFLTSGLQDDLSAWASSFFDLFVTDGTAYQMHAVGFVPGSNPRVIAEVNPIVAFTVDNQVDVQRRRRPGRGI